MIAVVCISDDGGIAFAKRRQSRDAALIQNLLSLTSERTLFINEYSLPLFKEYQNLVTVRSAPKAIAGDGDFIFLEREGISDCKEKIEALIIYRWNRAYPSDEFLDVSPEMLEFELFERTEFEGSSHKTITREIYCKKEFKMPKGCA